MNENQAISEESAPPRPRLALAVGINDYEPTRWQPLRHACSDASEIAEVLSFDEHGFEVTTLLDENATASSILQRLIQLLDRDPEVLVFYFSGHGASTAVGEFLVTYDNAPLGEGIALGVLAQLFSRSARTSCVAVLDCCHAGAATIADAGAASTALTRADIERTFPFEAGHSRAVLAACRAGEPAFETKTLEHGRFTFHVLEGLLGAAADGDGNISVLSLSDYISRKMDDPEQVPVFRGDLEGRLLLASGMTPALHPLVDEDEASRIERTAEQLLDGYGPPAALGYANWKVEGYRDAAQRLEPIYEWFEKRLLENPELERRETFSTLQDSLLARVAQLGTVDAGIVLPEGTLARRLGSGAFGAVWKVDSASGNSLAYKVYHSGELTERDKLARFRRGYDAMRQLDHPHIVHVHRFTSCPVGFFMDFVDGANLRDLNPAQNLDSSDSVRLLIETAETLEHAHNRGVIHRDIKPENIVCQWVDERWVPYLTDFDLAWFSTATQVTQEAFGSLYYAAPEQFVQYSGKAMLRRSPNLDVFSFGQLLFFVLMGSNPDPVALDRNLKSLSDSLSNWPSGEAARQVVSLYEDCTQWKPDARIQEFATVLSRLRDLAAELHPSTRGDISEPDRFLAELVFAFTGRPLESDSAPEYISTSERTRVSFAIREGAYDAKAPFLVVATLSSRGGWELPGVTYAELGSILAVRVDAAVALINDLPNTRRRSSDATTVTVEFPLNDLSWRTLSVVRDGVARVVATVETV